MGVAIYLERIARSFSVAFNPAHQRWLLLPTIQAHVDSRQSIIFPRGETFVSRYLVTSGEALSLFLTFVKHRPNLCFMRSDSVTSASETLSDYNQNNPLRAFLPPPRPFPFSSNSPVAFDPIKIVRSSYYQSWLFVVLRCFFFLFFAGTRNLLHSSGAFNQ